MIEKFIEAFHKNDAGRMRELFAEYPEMKSRINDPVGPFDSPAICNVRSCEMLDVLLEAGADINAKSKWWAGGFCLLDSASDELAQYAIERGARLEPNAAARLGLIDRLAELIAANHEAVNARGGDGQTPLHVARNVEVARFLVERGADINARDVDHESTPAQYAVGERQDVARYLAGCGCDTDIFLAAALGDMELARKHVEANPDCLRAVVSPQFFPMRHPRAGGTIYNWTLGTNMSPQRAARKFARREVFDFLMDRSPVEVRLVNWCWLGDHVAAKEIIGGHADVISKLDETGQRAMADAARDNNLEAVRAMLEVGWPKDVRGQHGGTALHWCAWHGNVLGVQLLLESGADISVKDFDFNGTPVAWSEHGSRNCWGKGGDHGKVVEILRGFGA